MNDLLVGIGTLMIGIGSILTAVVSLKSLRATRAVKVDVAENTAITKATHAVVTGSQEC
jgi:hypothetical protein